MILHEVHSASIAVRAAVDAEELSRQVSDAIRLRKRDATYNSVYFNVLYLEDLFRNVRGLEQAGFRHTIEEGETRDGHKVAAKLIAPDGSRLDLGAVLLDGENFTVIRELAPYQRVVNFVANHGGPTEDQNESPEEEQPTQEDLRQDDWQEKEQEQDHGTQSRRESKDPNAPDPRPPFSGYSPR